MAWYSFGYASAQKTEFGLDHTRYKAAYFEAHQWSTSHWLSMQGKTLCMSRIAMTLSAVTNLCRDVVGNVRMGYIWNWLFTVLLLLCRVGTTCFFTLRCSCLCSLFWNASMYLNQVCLGLDGSKRHLRLRILSKGKAAMIPQFVVCFGAESWPITLCHIQGQRLMGPFMCHYQAFGSFKWPQPWQECFKGPQAT